MTGEVRSGFLAYLAELDERQLFLDLGFASLFEYCVEKLGLCESTAGRHIAAARVCRNHPEAFEMVASGALHASALSLLRKHLSSENAAELCELCAHRSARKVEELLAARFPRPDVRDLVRRVPAQAGPSPDVGSASGKMPTVMLPREPEAELQKAPVESPSRELSAAPGRLPRIENLRLRCRAHNQRYARQYFGKSRVEAAVRHARGWRAVAEGSSNR